MKVADRIRIAQGPRWVETGRVGLRVFEVAVTFDAAYDVHIWHVYEFVINEGRRKRHSACASANRVDEAFDEAWAAAAEST